MTNFLLLLALAIGIAGLTSLLIISGVKWVVQNPIILVGITIGAAIATYCTLKFRNAQDEKLVRKFRREREYVEPIAQSQKTPKPQSVKSPEPNPARIKELTEALGKLGYTVKDARSAIAYVLQDSPNATDEEIVTACIHFLSDSRVGGVK